MNARRMLAGLSLAGVVTGAVLTFGASGASAATLEKSGWWYRPNSAPGPLGGAVPAPPDTPKDGLLVQATPDGPNAVAAVTFALGEDEFGGTLTLNVAGDTGGENANLQACPATTPYEPAQAGAFDKRPKEDCEFGTAPGVRSEDGKTFTFDVTALITENKVNVVILPAPLPEAAGAAPVYRPFSVSFEKPTSASLVPPEGASSDFEVGGDAGSFPAGGGDASGGGGTETAGGSFSPSVPSDISGPASDFTAPSVDGVALGGASALNAAPAPPAAAPTGTGGQALATSPTAGGGGLANRRSLGIGLMVLCGLAGVLLAATRSPAFASMLPPAMRPAGAAGASTEGGLGRFVRPRSGRAPAL